MEQGIRVSPSLMCMDLMHAATQIESLEGIADEYHADILDWHYCKNMSLAPCFVEGVSKLTDKPIEAHLYVDNIDIDLVELCMDSGTSVITMPPEVISRQVYRLKRAMERRDVRFGVFLNPSIGLECIRPYIEIVDRLLILTVDPGFAGQAFAEPTLKKVADASRLRDELGLSFDIEVDGCCNEKWYRKLRDAGADTFVLGSSGLFGKSSDIKEAVAIAQRNLNRELA